MNLESSPRVDEFELSLFGTGIGESIAIHTGNNEWLLIDSCRKNSDNLPENLSYLKTIGVDTEECVKLFLITHWHDDHIDGAVEIVKNCPNAKVAISAALSGDEFFKILSIYNQENYILDREKSGVRELGKVFEFIRRKKEENPNTNSIVRTRSDHLLFNNPFCNVHAISPSDNAIDNSVQEFSSVLRQISKNGERLVLSSPNRNHNAVALWIQFKSQTILLGSDLESTNDNMTGWASVSNINLFKSLPKEAKLFKIPHHGSPNGDHESIWKNLVSKDTPILVLTSYSRGKNPRPSRDDLGRLLTHTSDLYCTSIPKRSVVRRDPGVDRTMREASKKRWSIGKIFGQIRIRGMGLEDQYSVECIGSALQVRSVNDLYS